MCNPPAIIAAILSLATTVMQTRATNQAADEQADAIAAQAAANIGALEEKGVEVTEAASLERFERKKQLQREIAATRVAQSEGGVLFGSTALRTMATQLIGGGQDIAIIGKQEASIQKQIGRQKEAVAAGQAVQMAGLSWTSPLMAGVSGISGAMGAYTSAGGHFTTTGYAKT